MGCIFALIHSQAENGKRIELAECLCTYNLDAGGVGFRLVEH